MPGGVEVQVSRGEGLVRAEATREPKVEAIWVSRAGSERK